MTKELIGKANTILVSSDGPGVVTTITVNSLKQKTDKRLKFSGVVKFEEAVKFHIEKVVLPRIDEILDSLQIKPDNYETEKL